MASGDKLMTKYPCSVNTAAYRTLIFAHEECIVTHQAGNSEGSLQCFVHNLLLDFFNTLSLGPRRMIFNLFHSEVVRGVE